MRRLALLAIRAYQRHVSPYKGFSCAYRIHTGRASCSELGWRVIRRHGLWAGLQLLGQRTALCGAVLRQQPAPPATPNHLPWQGQRGLCDLGCDLPCDGGCDLPTGRGWGGVMCDLLNCCDCGSCERRPRRDKTGSKDRYVHIPPYSLRRDPDRQGSRQATRSRGPRND